MGSLITTGTPVTLPGSKTYRGDHPASAGATTFGRYLEVRRNGIKIYAGDTGFERDYKETGFDITGQTTVTFEFDLQIGDRMEYIIYEA